MGENLQYRRTHKSIINAFLVLAQKKNFEAITVQDILEEALVSRYTFYKHFQDKYEIAEILQEQLMEDFEQMKDRMEQEYADGIMDQMKQNLAWCQFAREHRDVFAALWKVHTETVDLREAFAKVFMESYLAEMAGKGLDSYCDLEAEICAGVMTILMNYFSKEDRLMVDSLGEPIRGILRNVFVYLAKVEPDTPPFANP